MVGSYPINVNPENQLTIFNPTPQLIPDPITTTTGPIQGPTPTSTLIRPANQKIITTQPAETQEAHFTCSSPCDKPAYEYHPDSPIQRPLTTKPTQINKCVAHGPYTETCFQINEYGSNLSTFTPPVKPVKHSGPTSHDQEQTTPSKLKPKQRKTHQIPADKKLKGIAPITQ
jgi:hypothetical protein